MTRPRIAVIGAGHLGGIHARLLAGRADAELACIVDPDESACQAVAARHGVTPLSRVEEAFPLADAAIVAAPTSLHHSIGLQLLAEGKHVLMEKPLASNSEEAQALADAAASENRILQVGHVERFNPAWTTMADRLRDVRFVNASRASGFSFRCMDVGVVLDLMIHDLDLVLSIVPAPITHVEACGMTVMGPHEDIVSARLKFANGCAANFYASRISHENVRRLNAWTEHGFAKIDMSVHTAIWVGMREDIEKRRFDATKLGLDDKRQYKDRVFHELLPIEHVPAEPINAIQHEQDEFIRGIVTGAAPRVDGRQALRAVEAAEQVLAALAADRRQVGDLVEHPEVVPLPDRRQRPPSIGEHREAG